MTSITIGNYRIEQITGGVAVFFGNERGIHNALRIFATTDEARAWIAKR